MMSTTEGSRKKFKRPKFLRDVYLQESCIRSDEVSSEIVRARVERCFKSDLNGRGTQHVVQDHLQHFGIHNMESNSVNPSNFKTFSSIIDNLNDDALCAVANIVSNNNVSFKKTRSRMKKVIKNYLPSFSTESPTSLRQLSDIFRNPCNFQEKQVALVTSTIHKTLKRLGELPTLDLIAMNRKLNGHAIVPQFPTVLYGCNKDVLIDRVKKKCEGFLSDVEKGDVLPQPLAKALSVMLLALNLKSGSVEMPTSTFYPFPLDIVCLQQEVLNALWSLPKFKYADLKALLPLVDPEAKCSPRNFRPTLRNYLKEYLFACDEMCTPKEVQSALTFINGMPACRPCMFSNETVEEEVEAVLCLSSQFKEVISDLIPDHSIDEECGAACSGGLGTDESIESDDFELSARDYFSGSDDCEPQQAYDSCSNDETETMGDSRPNSAPITFNSTNPSQLAMAARNMTGNILKKPILEQNRMSEAETIGEPRPNPVPITAIDPNSFQLGVAARNITGNILKKPKLEQDRMRDLEHCSEKLIKASTHAFQRTTIMGEKAVQDICDKTAVFAHGLIGCMLEKFLQSEGRDVGAMTRNYLRGGSSSPVDSQGAESLLNTLKEDVKAQVLIQSVEELLPSVPMSCMKRVKTLMELP